MNRRSDSIRYSLKNYPDRCDEIYSKQKIEKVIKKLPAEKREFISRQHKYQLRSYFLNKNYSFSDDWEFIAFNTDYNYYDKQRSLNLKCECGRKLKYQYVIKSLSKNKTLKLGISHFKDHLNISDELAYEIKKGITEVDLAINELLWLCDTGVSFPIDLWEKYLFAIYKYQKMSPSFRLNKTLLERINNFKQADVPIFISDYFQVIREIKLIDEQEKYTSCDIDMEEFRTLKSEWNQQLQLMVCDPHEIINSKEKPRNEILNESYFDNLLALLLSTEKNDNVIFLRRITDECCNAYTSKEQLITMLKYFNDYHLSDSFFIRLPLFYASGIKKALDRVSANRLKLSGDEKFNRISQDLVFASILGGQNTLSKETNNYLNKNNIFYLELVSGLHYFLQGIDFEEAFSEKIKPIIDELKPYLSDIYNNYSYSKDKINIYNPKLSFLYLEWLSLDVKQRHFFEKLIIKDQTSIYSPIKLDSLFFDKLFLLLINISITDEEKAVSQFESLFQLYGIKDWELAFNLIEAVYKYNDKKDYDSSFCLIVEPFYSELKHRYHFKYESIYRKYN